MPTYFKMGTKVPLKMFIANLKVLTFYSRSKVQRKKLCNIKLVSKIFRPCTFSHTKNYCLNMLFESVFFGKNFKPSLSSYVQKIIMLRKQCQTIMAHNIQSYSAQMTKNNWIV